MKKEKNEITILLERRRLKSGRGDDPLDNFWEKIHRGVLLVDFAEKAGKTGSRKIKSESRRQFIVNLVTAFEVYMIDLITELIDENKIDIDKLNLKVNLPIQDVINLIINKVAVSEVVCAYNNFQNVESTGKFLSDIFDLQPTLFGYLKTHAFTYLDDSSKQKEINFDLDFENKLDKIFKNRHNFIHDISFKNTPTYKELISSRQLVINFVFSIEILANKFRNNRDCKILDKIIKS